uniref:Uncharacterized protein n=1 Tax=Romanomermis culicivorax TaxID=13658 RepID=A0A915KDA0_ROMCU
HFKLFNNSLCPLSADCKSRKQPKEHNTLLKKKHKLSDKLEKENVEDVKQKYNQCLRDIKQYTYSQKGKYWITKT